MILFRRIRPGRVSRRFRRRSEAGKRRSMKRSGSAGTVPLTKELVAWIPRLAGLAHGRRGFGHQRRQVERQHVVGIGFRL